MHINADRYQSPWQGRQEFAVSENGEGAEKTYREQILEKMAEMARKVKDGTVEPTFQIGSMSYTMKEWDKLLEKFDAAEEALQAEVEAQIEEAEKQAAKEDLRRELDGKAGTVETKTAAALLTEEVTKCSYPTENPGQKHWFITAYGPDGISCKEAYFDGSKWVNRDCWGLSYPEEGQYEKVLAFLKRFPADANLRFASQESFWKAFLAGQIDEDDFVASFEEGETENWEKTVDNKR